MSFILKPVDIVESITPEDFKKNYLNPRKPLIIKGLTKDWPAREKWTTEYLKEIEESLEERQKLAEEKEEQAEILKRKYQKMFEEKNSLQDKVRVFESNLMKHQNEKMLFENENNNLMIIKAQINAKKETPEVIDHRGFGIKAWQCPTFAWRNTTLSSAQSSFTSEFEMGSGGSHTLWPPGKLFEMSEDSL